MTLEGQQTIERSPNDRPPQLPRTPAGGTASVDPYAVREVGVEHIRRLAGLTWTDHNVHDPGITALETLCYALTDLHYRIGHPVADLLAEQRAGPDEPPRPPQFFTADEVLTSHPVTARDIQKLLIDVSGVKFARLGLAERGEVSLSFDRDELALATAPGEAEEEVRIRGLYRLYLELDEDRELGDLNAPTVVITLVLGGPETRRAMSFTAEFRYWRTEADDGEAEVHEIADADWSRGSFEWRMADEAAPGSATVERLRPEDGEGWWITVRLDAAGEPVTLEARLTAALPRESAAREEIEAALQADGNAALADLTERYLAKVRRRREIVQAVLARMHANRSLCEDLLSIHGVRVERVGVCAAVEVRPEADIERVLAEILEAIAEYLSPEIRMLSLEEMLEAGVPVEHIFEGPRLSRGFIPDEAIDAYAQRDAVYTSDLVRMIMDTAGVLSVQEVSARRIGEDGELDAAAWELALSGDPALVPRLDLGLSDFLFYRRGLPYAPDLLRVEALRAELRARRGGLGREGAREDLPIPEGRYRDPGRHHSIQRDFPLVYGVGPEGLDPSADVGRRAQARQLKAYLTFFDQLLADFLAQLAHAKDLLSVQADAPRTLFTQPAWDVPDLAPLLRDFTASVPQPFLAAEPGRYESAWDSYRALGDESGYARWLDELAEDERGSLERRNALLDHLLARFAEDFVDYALALSGVRSGEEALRELAEAKAAFLRDYPSLSYARARAVDYLDPQRAWQAGAISGFERRVRRLLGIAEGARRELSFMTHETLALSEADGEWSVRLLDREGEPALAAEGTPGSREEAEALAAALLEAGGQPERYRATATAEGDWELQLVDVADVLLARSAARWPDEPAASAAACALAAYARAVQADPVRRSVTLVEHEGPEWSFEVALPGEDGQPALTLAGEQRHPGPGEAREAVRRFVALVVAGNRAVVREREDGRFIVAVLDADGSPVAATTSTYASAAEAQTARERLVRRVEREFSPEGMHLVEHVLLRPRAPGDTLLPLGLEEDCELPAQRVDPYSFQVSVFLPAWPARFRDLVFREQVERALRMEAPAHLALRICWLDSAQLAELDDALREWACALAARPRDAGALEPARAALVRVMEEARTVYPEARLHDRRGTGSVNPIVLGQAQLGTIAEGGQDGEGGQDVEGGQGSEGGPDA